jgi:sterol desaturase/sphingolipid hydroxylase (fatty acid hydroxylase superfamily)
VTPTRWFPGNDGARHHDLHHARVRGNYAGFFPIWDRAFGTLARGCSDDLSRRTPDDRPHGTITPRVLLWRWRVSTLFWPR